MAARYSEAERARWVSRFRASGLSCERFARTHGLSPSTLYRWAQQADADAPDVRPGFAQVHVVGSGAPGSTVEIEHPGGCLVRIIGAVDESQLSAVLRALAAC